MDFKTKRQLKFKVDSNKLEMIIYKSKKFDINHLFKFETKF